MSNKKSGPCIISASRRTDIPHYYAAWFHARRMAGFAHYRTVFGGGKKGFYEASLLPKDVIGYLFWTKFAGPFHDELKLLRKENVPFVFQYTITGYGEDVQPGIPANDAAIKDFLAVRDLLPGSAAIQWRYDPILISDKIYDYAWHVKNFTEIATGLEGKTCVVNVSFTEPYQRAIVKAPEGHNFSWRQSAEQVDIIYKKHPELRAVGEREIELLFEFEKIARERGMQLRSCCNKEYSAKFPTAQCCGAELFAPYGDILNLQVSGLPDGPSRPSCKCLKTVDIGMDNTCPGGCFYCYVTTSVESAIHNYKKHDPNAPMLR